MDPVTLRGLERILVVLIGGLTVYLGYKLFLHIPDQKDSEGKVNLPGGISIFMTRIGPGAFFALFGAIVVIMSFRYSISYLDASSAMDPVYAKARTTAKKAGDTTAALPAGSVQYVGLSPAASDEQLQSDIYFLNADFPLLLKPDLPQEKNDKVAEIVPRIKLALLRAGWKQDWGDFNAFATWVRTGANNPVPDKAAPAAERYNYGK